MHTCLTGWLHCQSRFNRRHIVTGLCRKAVSSYRSKVYLWSTLSLHKLQRLTHFMVSSKHLNQPQIHTVRFLPTTYLQSTVLLVACRQTEETGEVELGSCRDSLHKQPSWEEAGLDNLTSYSILQASMQGYRIYTWGIYSIRSRGAAEVSNWITISWLS